MSRDNLHLLDTGPLPEPIDYDPVEVRARLKEARFQFVNACPWWVGQYPVVFNAIRWVTGVDAAAVYEVRGQLAAVVARRVGRKVVWATADLGEAAARLVA